MDKEEFEKIEELNEESDFDSFDSYDNSSSNNVDFENTTNNSNAEQINGNSNETPQTDSSNLREKLDKNKGYKKTDSKRQAYENTLDNKNYYNDKKNELENSRNKLQKDKKENKEKRDSAEKRLEQAKQNKLNNNNKNNRKELREAKKEDKEAKRENKEQEKKEKQLKKDEKNIKKDSKKAKQFAARHPVEAAKMAASHKIKKIKKQVIAKIVSICAPIVLGILLAFFIIYLILSPLMEIWNNIDEGITKVADFGEKLSNFYSGFGFQNSKEAFYDEVNELYDRYGSDLDVPLLLSTIFYTEGFGYDTEYSETEALDVKDPTVSGNNSSVLSSIREYLREKFDESYETEDELTYTVGQIYRLRKLARNQFHTDVFGTPTREGQTEVWDLDEFVAKYGKRVGKDILDVVTDFAAGAISAATSLFKEMWASIVGSKYQGEFFDNVGYAFENSGYSLLDLFGDVFYGIADVEDIYLDGVKIKVKVKTYEFDEENYDKYLMDYYLEKMPEFQEILPGNEAARKEKKEQIIQEIYANKELFEDIFLKYVDTASEAYVDTCVGGINSNLVSELQLPVNIPEGTTISFTDNYTAFGIRDGVSHNGVDLNSATAGVNEGDLVYAIAKGEVVESLPYVSCNTRTDSSCEYSQGAWVKIKHDIVIDGKEYKFYSVYMHLQTQSGQPAVGTKVNKGDVIGKIGNTGDSSGAHLHFEFRDDDGSADGVAVDPTNLFIPCNTTILVGNDNTEKIWNYFVSKGYPKAGVAGIMGNIQTESAFESQIVQGDVPMTVYSINYTKQVDTGQISRYAFANQGPGGGGYGLVQWTYYSRKEGLYDYAKSLNVSIGDLSMQLQYLDNELQTSYAEVYQTVTSSGVTVDAATRKFMTGFENPADQSESAKQGRVNNAQAIYNLYANQ